MPIINPETRKTLTETLLVLQKLQICAQNREIPADSLASEAERVRAELSTLVETQRALLAEDGTPD